MRITEPYTIFLRTLASGRKVYYYQYRDDEGKRSSIRSTGCTSLAKARRYCEKLYQSGQFKLKPSILFKVFTKDIFSKEGEFYRWKVISGHKITDSSLSLYKNALKNYLLPFFAEIRIDKITVDTVKEWRVWINSKYKANTVKLSQLVLKHILEQAIEKKIILQNPCSMVSGQKIVRKEKILLTIEELKKIFAADWDKTAKRACLTACITGMRIGEVIALQDSDVQKNFLNVYKSYSEIYGLGDTKTHKKRYVPIPCNFKLKSGTTWVFEKEGKPFPRSLIYKKFRECLKSLGIDYEARGITIHSFRNFFISYMEKESVPFKKIQATVGHTDGTMTEWYTFWKPDMLQEVYIAQQKLYDIITGGSYGQQQQGKDYLER